MRNRTQRQFLTDIVEAMSLAEEFVADMEFEELEDDLKTQLALERLFGIIGEAAKKVSPELRTQYTEIPWAEMAGMRDVLVHGYWAVRLDVVWESIHHDFPETRSLLQQVQAELPPDS